jgi:hypothetical protein
MKSDIKNSGIDLFTKKVGRTSSIPNSTQPYKSSTGMESKNANQPGGVFQIRTTAYHINPSPLVEAAGDNIQLSVVTTEV